MLAVVTPRAVLVAHVATDEGRGGAIQPFSERCVWRLRNRIEGVPRHIMRGETGARTLVAPRTPAGPALHLVLRRRRVPERRDPDLEAEADRGVPVLGDGAVQG